MRLLQRQEGPKLTGPRPVPCRVGVQYQDTLGISVEVDGKIFGFVGEKAEDEEEEVVEIPAVATCFYAKLAGLRLFFLAGKLKMWILLW